MKAGFPDLETRIQSVREAIRRAAARSGRHPGAIRLIGVVKTVPPETVRQAVDLGLEDLGENRVQEAESKVAAVGRRSARWHMIGHLQSNKVARALELFDRVHGVDDLDLARTISKRAHAVARTMPILIEVNVSGEGSKHGVAPEGLESLLAEVVGLPGLALDGLMTVGRPVVRPEEARPDFARLRALRERAESRLGFALPELSMGMSGDFEVAVEEGATMVRVGSALFGPRA